MGWIDDDKAELERQKLSAAELSARQSEIAGYSATIFDNLWDEITARAAEAAGKGLPRLLTNGSPYERKVLAMRPIKPGQSFSKPNECHLKLAKDQQSIVFSGDKISIHMLLDLCDDGVVRIRHEGEHKDIKEMARFILRPLFFPELFGEK